MTQTIKKSLIVAIACLAVMATGCRCTIAVSFDGDADATMEAGKLYDDVSIDPAIKLPVIP